MVVLRPLKIIATDLAFHALRAAKEADPNKSVIGEVTAAELLAISVIRLMDENMPCPACGSDAWDNQECSMCTLGSIVDDLYPSDEEDAEASHLSIPPES